MVKIKLSGMARGMARLIVQLFNMSICLATFPVLWKRASYIQCYACLEVLSAAALTSFCLQAIFVLPVMSKLLERILCDQLMAHINNFDLLSIFLGLDFNLGTLHMMF